MKRKNTIWSLVLALVMVLGVFAPLGALAAEDEKTETLTIHKILMDKDKLKTFNERKVGIDGTKYDGNEIANPKKFFNDDKLQEIYGVYFIVKDAATGKYVTPDGTKTEYPDQALRTNVTGGKDGMKLDTSKLPAGEYLIEEDQSKSKPVGEDGQALKKELSDTRAVPIKITLPLVNSEGVVKDAHVYPKNTENEPNVDKNFDKEAAANAVKKVELIGDVKNLDVNPATGETAEKSILSRKIGDKVPFKVVTTVPEKAKYKVFEWSDNMVEGLKYNKDLKVQLNGTDLVENTDYTKTETDTGFTLKLTETGLAKVTDKNAEQTFTITYSATIKGDLTPDKEVPNKLVLTYGNNPDDKKKKEPKPPKVVTGGKKFVKTEWKDATAKDLKKLGGAEFYVKNSENKYLIATGTGAEKAYSWGAKDQAGVVVLKSDTNGKFEITGLAYGDYSLEEKTPPTNYAKITTPIPFKIEKGSYTTKDVDISYNGDSTIDAKQVKNKEIIIPQTGGMGTALFMVVGMALMGGAFIAMRKRGAEQA